MRDFLVDVMLANAAFCTLCALGAPTESFISSFFAVLSLVAWCEALFISEAL